MVLWAAVHPRLPGCSTVAGVARSPVPASAWRSTSSLCSRPACAGIGLRRFRWACWSWLPRMRGDRSREKRQLMHRLPGARGFSDLFGCAPLRFWSLETLDWFPCWG